VHNSNCITDTKRRARDLPAGGGHRFVLDEALQVDGDASPSKMDITEAELHLKIGR
jgi:hypothetical protein